MGTLDHGRLANCFYTIGNDAKRAFLDFDRPVRIYFYFLIIIMKTDRVEMKKRRIDKKMYIIGLYMIE